MASAASRHSSTRSPAPVARSSPQLGRAKASRGVGKESATSNSPTKTVRFGTHADVREFSLSDDESESAAESPPASPSASPEPDKYECCDICDKAVPDYTLEIAEAKTCLACQGACPIKLSRADFLRAAKFLTGSTPDISDINSHRKSADQARIIRSMEAMLYAVRSERKELAEQLAAERSLVARLLSGDGINRALRDEVVRLKQNRAGVADMADELRALAAAVTERADALTIFAKTD